MGYIAYYYDEFRPPGDSGKTRGEAADEKLVRARRLAVLT
jgi:hypothetical protein